MLLCGEHPSWRGSLGLHRLVGEGLGVSEPSVLAEVARLLHEMRLSRGWSCEELAQKAGLPLEEVTAYESDPTRLEPDVALQIFKAMPTDPADERLFGSASAEPEPPASVLAAMEVNMLKLEAALRIDQGKFQRAVQTLNQALSLGPDREQLGGLLFMKGTVLSEMDRERQGWETLGEAERCLSREEKPRLFLRLRLEQIHLLIQSKRYEEAEAYLRDAESLAETPECDRERLNLKSFQGSIAAGLGRTDEAIERLRSVREELLASGRVFDATAVSLELATLLARRGLLPEVQELTDQLEELIPSKKIPSAARLTLKAFCRVARSSNLSADRIRRFAVEFLKAGGRLTRPFELPT
jgi:tetratricopeptide (TPR) repeat protein